MAAVLTVCYQIKIRQSIGIYLKNVPELPAKFNLNPIWNYAALGFFCKGRLWLKAVDDKDLTWPLYDLLLATDL